MNNAPVLLSLVDYGHHSVVSLNRIAHDKIIAQYLKIRLRLFLLLPVANIMQL